MSDREEYDEYGEKILYVEDFFSQEIIDKLDATLPRFIKDKRYIDVVFDYLDSDDEAELLLAYLNSDTDITVDDIIDFCLDVKAMRNDAEEE